MGEAELDLIITQRYDPLVDAPIVGGGLVSRLCLVDRIIFLLLYEIVKSSLSCFSMEVTFCFPRFRERRIPGISPRVGWSF